MNILIHLSLFMNFGYNILRNVPDTCFARCIEEWGIKLNIIKPIMTENSKLLTDAEILYIINDGLVLVSFSISHSQRLGLKII